jgi:hypothetical protein
VFNSSKVSIKHTNFHRNSITKAWSALSQDRAELARIEVLKYRAQEKPVYRMFRVATEYPTIIAKRSSHNRAMSEHTIYKEVLPKLSLPVPHYFGYVKEPKGQFGWFFLEDVGDEKYRSYIKEHRVAAAQWLGVMHVTAASLAAGTNLPERGPGHYLNLLQSANNTIQSFVANTVLKKEERSLLEAIISHCKNLLMNWSQLVDTNQGIPRTLVHGDFIENNVRIQSDEEKIIVLPFDWEKAGWGIPAEDISNVDIQTYWTTVREHWPNLYFPTLARLARVGKIYRCLVYLDWIATELVNKSFQQFLDDLRKCDVWLTELI